TSDPWKRRSAGRRTAWLRPLRKSLAIRVMVYIMIYTMIPVKAEIWRRLITIAVRKHTSRILWGVSGIQEPSGEDDYGKDQHRREIRPNPRVLETLYRGRTERSAREARQAERRVCLPPSRARRRDVSGGQGPLPHGVPRPLCLDRRRRVHRCPARS